MQRASTMTTASNVSVKTVSPVTDSHASVITAGDITVMKMPPVFRTRVRQTSFVNVNRGFMETGDFAESDVANKTESVRKMNSVPRQLDSAAPVEMAMKGNQVEVVFPPV